MSAIVVSGNEPWRSAALDLANEHDIEFYLARNGTGGYAEVSDRAICAPEPRGSSSFATFAHEVGHVALHTKQDRPRWAEEAEAWRFARQAFRDRGLRWPRTLDRKMVGSIAYSWSKALRRTRDPETMRREMRRRLPSLAKRVLPRTRI